MCVCVCVGGARVVPPEVRCSLSASDCGLARSGVYSQPFAIQFRLLLLVSVPSRVRWVGVSTGMGGALLVSI